MNITICYLTSRKEPQFKWFLDSLALQVDRDIRLVIVDRWAEVRDDWNELQLLERERAFRVRAAFSGIFTLEGVYLHVPPKPTPWAGEHRLTKRDHFAASNARNTGLCLAPDGYIVYVDDLSVLLPGWWRTVLDAVEGGYVACGTYKKQRDLVVQNGRITSFTPNPPGWDPRPAHGNIAPFSDPVSCLGEWLYGCSLAIPTEALLRINGWPEECDGMGFEDCVCGWMLQHHGGYPIKFCPRMITWESEEGHVAGDPAERVDKGQVKLYSGYPDCQHALLDWVRSGKRSMANNGEANIFPSCRMARERDRVFRGEAFTKYFNDDAKHWPDGALIAGM